MRTLPGSGRILQIAHSNEIIQKDQGHWRMSHQASHGRIQSTLAIPDCRFACMQLSAFCHSFRHLRMSPLLKRNELTCSKKVTLGAPCDFAHSIEQSRTWCLIDLTAPGDHSAMSVLASTPMKANVHESLCSINPWFC